ncbi:MAG: hypothetical protein CMP49_06540 [Flavobacteriales bacterium]|nr:hypothetical protein [Flavobacteriales bacterium]|tara:strand:- start:389 stop:940 length:552 start_codon:yes stop_codon:yes gene_type:complete
MLNQFKLKIASFILKNEFLKNDESQELITLSSSKKIGLLFEADHSQSIQCVKQLLKYFSKFHFSIDALGFVNSRKEDSVHISTIHMNYFNLTDLNLFGIPNSQKIKQFCENEYDILINLSLNNNFQLKYLAFTSNAKYKVGIFDSDKVFNYDLMFKLKVKTLDYFIEHLIYYLELIDKNNEKQ